MTIATLISLARKWTSSLWQRVVLFGVGFFISAEIAIFLSPEHGRYLSFWLPAGLSIAVLLLSPTRDWKWLLLMILPANWLFDYFFRTPFPMIVCFWAANIGGAFTGAWMVRVFVADCPRLKTLKEFVGLILFGAVLSSMLSATIGAAGLAHFGLSPSFWHSWRSLLGGDIMAILILTTFILTWFSPSNDWRARFNSRKKITEAGLLLLGLGAVLWYLTDRDQGVMSPNKSLIVPFLLWAGLRFGTHGATAVCLFISLVLPLFSMPHFPALPSGLVTSGEYVFVLQTVVAMSVLVSLIPAIVLGERDQTMVRLRESEEHYRKLTEAAFEGIVILENGRVVDVNEQMLKLFNYQRDEMMGRDILEVVAPESRPIAVECIQKGREDVHELRLLRKDGSSFITETRARMVHAGDRTLRMVALRDITAQKQVQQALHESEEKFSKAFHNSPDVMSITDLETGRYIEVNDAHEKTFGFKREEVIGRSAIELDIFPDSPLRNELLRTLREGGRVVSREFQGRTRDGRPLILLHSAEVVELGGRKCILRVSHDVTDQKAAEEALRESERRFRSYFELAAVGFSISSRETRLLAVNDEYCRILGYSREELLQKTWVELTWPEDLKPNEILFDQAVSGQTDAYTLNKRMIRKDGQVIHTTVSVRCVRRPDGVPDYFVGLLLDITEREQAIEREQQARAEYTLRLIASQEAERERIAGELHDSLGQSLSIIKNHVQLILLQKRIPAPVRKELETISETTSAAIAEMRRISQDLHPYQLDHLGLTGALTALIENSAAASHIAFERKFDAVDGVFSRDDASNLYRIVQEAMNNILKHSGAKNSRITLERDLHEVRLFIQDDGHGFSLDGQAKGMGLKNMAERARILGGRLKLDSSPGNGVRIEIVVPISAERE